MYTMFVTGIGLRYQLDLLSSTSSTSAIRRMRRHLAKTTSFLTTTASRRSISSTMASPTALRIPVISYIPGLGDAVRSKLRIATCPASDLFRSNHLQLLDVPLPPAANSTDPWELNDNELDMVANASVLLGDAHTCAHAILAPSSISIKQQPSTPIFGKLKWMQATYAGIDAFQKRIEADKLEPPSFILTRAGGIMPTAMAQYVFGWIIAIERKFFEAREHQARKDWNKQALDYRPFKDLTVGILGFGDIGQEIGRTLKASGFQVLGFKRSVNATDAVESLDCAHRVTNNLQHVLEKSDFVVSVLPSTPSTRQLLNENNLGYCARKKPVFINVGRGDVVSEAALVTALEKKWISRAVLDVFAVEPLPEQSPLWSHPLVHVTPHVSAKSFPQDVADVFIRNLNAHLAREPLQYKVNWAHGY